MIKTKGVHNDTNANAESLLLTKKKRSGVKRVAPRLPKRKTHKRR